MADLDDDDLPEADALFLRLKRWFKADAEHSSDWRKEAKEDYDFVAGNQWDDADIRKLEDQQRPVITFNRTDPIIRSVVGEQINNAQEVRYLPREMGDVQKNETLTDISRAFRDQCNADDEESDAFSDTVTCGLGWTDTRMDHDEDPDEPTPVIERIDPLEMFWDCDARKRNLADARRIARAREMSIASAREMFPDEADADLDASWASSLYIDGVKSRGTDRDEYSGGGQDNDLPRKGDDAQVTIVQMQWRDSATFFKVLNPLSGQIEELDEETFESVKPKLEEMGPVQSVKIKRTIIREAFLGAKVLKDRPKKCPEFTFQPITGFRDRNKGSWYGLVRSMKDPQRWANKWLSQTLHIMNTTAKGGVMVEEGALGGSKAEFERTFAKPDSVTSVPDGTLSNPMGARIQPKPTGQFPAGFFNMMQFAVSSVRDVSGISLEMLGMREADQPASLEFQRKQAGITILAQLFRSMKRYHRTQGKVMLYYIQNLISPETMVKIIGTDGREQYQPMEAAMAAMNASAKYDVVVDEGPTSPNNKERIWAMVGQNIWDLPPEVQMALLPYSPLPESAVQKIQQAGQAAAESPSAKLEQRLKEVEAFQAEQKALLYKAQADKVQVETQRTAMGVGEDGESGPSYDPMASQVEMQKVQAETQVKGAKIAADYDLGMQKIASNERINASKVQSSERQNAVKTAVQAETAREAAKNRPKPASRPQ